MSDVEMVTGSVEYLHVDVTCDVVLDQQPVEIGLGSTVDKATWTSAAWEGDAGTTRTCRILLDGSLAASKYNVFVKIHDTPEIPIVRAGVLRIKS